MGRKCDGAHGIPVNCGMLPLGDASSLWVSVDSSCKQRVCGIGLTPDVGSAERLLGEAACLKHMKPHQLSDNNEPYGRSHTSFPASQTSDMFEQLCPWFVPAAEQAVLCSTRDCGFSLGDAAQSVAEET